MKLYFNNLIIIISSFLMISCSSVSDLDISSIIDKTENWLFSEEDLSDTEIEGILYTLSCKISVLFF